jgi:flagellar export protein FliJ
MAFKFRLETLLRLKRLNESQALDRFGSSQAALQACELALDDLHREREQASQSLAGTDEGSFSALEFGLIARQLDILLHRIEATSARREELDSDLHARREELRARVCERKGHERIKESDRRRWLKKLRRRLLKRMDEAGSRSKEANRE